MATVIRSARIASDAVTLAIGRKHGDQPLPAQAVESPPSGDMTADMQVGIPQVAMMPTHAEHAFERRLAALQEQETKLQERERMLQAQLAEERERVLKQAYADGCKQGEASGIKQFDEQLHVLREVVRSLKQDFSNGVSNLEDVVVSIAFEAVCKIIGGVMHDADGVLAVVREVMSRVKDQEGLMIRVSPQNYDVLHRHWDALFGEGQDSKHELVADDRVALGGCLVETSGGTLDGRLEIQLQQLRDVLVAAHRMLPE